MFTLIRNYREVTAAGGHCDRLPIMVAASSSIQTATSGKVWFWVGVGVFVLAFVIWFLSWTNGPLCDPNSPFQGHGVWLLLSAAAVGCLYKYFRAEEGTQTT